MVECVAVPHLLEQANLSVVKLRKSHRLFEEKDRLSPSLLLPLAVEELDELAEAYDQNDAQAALGELMDVINYCLSNLQVTNRQPASFSNLMQGVNGYGKNSWAIERTCEVILDSEDDYRAIAEYLRRLFSIGQYLPIPFVSINQFNEMILKVAANRPVQFYSGLDPLTGRALAGEDAVLAFQHFEKCFRTIRNHVQRTLQPQDWQLHQAEIADWRHSAENLTKLRQQLKVAPA